MVIWQFLESANLWVSSHRDLLTLLFVPLLTWFVASFSGRISVKRAVEERRLEREIAQATRRLERELARKLKLADFRQSWISGLWEELATLTSLTLNPAGQSREEINQINLARAKVVLRLNASEERAIDLLDALNVVIIDAKQGDVGEHQTSLVSAGQALLKHEWDRLKTELADIQNEDRP